MFTQDEIVKAFGPYIPGDVKDSGYIQQCIQEIELFPQVLKAFYTKLLPEHQSACYREGSWTFRQVIHHLADSHMQAFQRFKLALTEENPIIKPYIQNAWATTDDSIYSDAGISIALLEALHARWTVLMKSMSIEDFSKTYYHPEQEKDFTLGYALGLYAWHGRHHYTQLYRYASNNGWI